MAFVVGFSIFWAVGSRLSGARSLSQSLPKTTAQPQAVAAGAPREYPVAPAVDLRTFRDLAYVPVKGLYLTSFAASNAELLNGVLGVADRTEVNAVVVDTKDDTGYVTYGADVALAKQLGLIEKRIPDIDQLVATLRRHNLVPIARVVVFKDPLLTKRRPEWAIQHKDGGVWKDRKGVAYVNPYNRQVWDYVVRVAEDAVKHGFREIQFDYVRFPSDGDIDATVYPGKDGSPEDCIAAFLAYARGRLEPKGVWVSADVFGLTVHVKDDLGIGQKIEKVARSVDIVCPMVYPSHYYAGSYNIDNPNASPYETVTAAMKDSARRLAGTGAINRPWLQDFSLGEVDYGVAQVKAQIKAVEEQGFREWILWDPDNTYTEGALRPQ